MYVVMNSIAVDPEHAEIFEQHFSRSMDGTLGSVGGLVRSTLLRPVTAGEPYVAQITFDSEESFQGWLSSDAFRAAHGHGPSGGSGGSGGSDSSGDGPNVVAYEVVNEVAAG